MTTAALAAFTLLVAAAAVAPVESMAHMILVLNALRQSLLAGSDSQLRYRSAIARAVLSSVAVTVNAVSSVRSCRREGREH